MPARHSAHAMSLSLSGTDRPQRESSNSITLGEQDKRPINNKLGEQDKRPINNKSLFVLLGLLCISLSSSLGNAQDTPPPELAPNSETSPSPTDDTLPADTAPVAPLPVDTAPLPPQSKPQAAAPARMVAHSASLSVRSFTPDATLAAILKSLEGLGAYVQSSSGRSVELRVPSEQFDKALVIVREGAEVVDEQVSSDDFQLEWVSSKARLDEAENSRQRTVRMLDEATLVEDALAIEQALSLLMQELEALQGRLRVLEARAQLAVLRIDVSMNAKKHVERLQTSNPFPWVTSYGLESLLP